MRINYKVFIILTAFFIFLGTFTTGVLRFLDDSPIVATYHMTFSFSLALAISFHITNKWESVLAFLKGQKLELFLASLVFTLLLVLGYFFHAYSIGSTVI